MVTLLDVFYITAILKERLFACMIVFCSVDLFFNTIGIFYLFLAFGLFLVFMFGCPESSLQLEGLVACSVRDLSSPTRD